MDLEIRGKTAVVIGGSRGIGKAIAIRFAKEGANVGICARGEEALKLTAEELRSTGIEVYAAACDAGNLQSLDGFLDETKKALGSVDILVNNASGFGMSDDEEGWSASLDVDLLGAVRASKKVVPWMSDAGGGVIIHISSISGLAAGSPPAYAAAKAALISHAKTMAVALAPKGIRVNSVAPGSIYFPGGSWDIVKRDDREFYDSMIETIPWGRMGNPAEVADGVVFLASARASWITGVCLAVDGGQHKGNH